MNKAGLSPHRKKSLCDASMIAHASVIGVSGSVNNPDCLPARSRDTLSKERCQFAKLWINEWRVPMRRPVARIFEMGMGKLRETRGEGYRTSDRSRRRGRATAPRTIAVSHHVLASQDRSSRFVASDSADDRRRDGVKRSRDRVPLARGATRTRKKSHSNKHSPRCPRLRRSLGRLRASRLHHSTRTHTLYLRSRRWY